MSKSSKSSDSKSIKGSKTPRTSKDGKDHQSTAAGKPLDKSKPAAAPEPKIVRETRIIKPELDEREYRALILPNQLRVLLISDSTTDKSAAALSVQVGSLTDPWERQGLAHLVEHALFLSTRKYPTDNFLKTYINGRGGTVNAETTLTDTVFYFDVPPAFLPNTLDRFASVFSAPLFPEDKVQRELDAIHFEFENRFTDDDHRCERVRKQVGLENHVYAKFELGNKTTLVKDDKLLSDVINFYKNHYSANTMGLAVLGKESLDQLEKFVVPMFSKIPNKSITSPLIEQHPYPKEHCRQLIRMVPFKDIRKLILFFPLPNTMRSNALDYIVWLLGHEGPGGLLAELKRRGFCTTIRVRSPYYHGFAFLNIEMDLTQGITANDEIISTVFQYLKLLSVRPQRETYNEIKAIKSIKFHYRDKVEPINYVYNLCFNLHVSLERCVLGRPFPDFVAEDIKYILERLTPETVNIQVVSPIFKTELRDFKIDPLYGIQYAVEPIKPEQLDAWSKVELNPRLVLPEINDLIPHNFTLKPLASSESDGPQLISSSGDPVRVWHLQDGKYRVPKAFFGVFFRSERLHSSPLNLNLITLYIKLYMDHVNQQFFSGRLVSNSYSLAANKFGLELFVYGYNDRLETYAMSLICELINYKIDPARYEILRDTQENLLKSFSSWAIRTQLNFILDILVSSNAWTHDELMACWGEVTLEGVQTLVSDILSHCQLEIFAFGNITKDESLAFSKHVSELMTKSCSKPGHAPVNPMAMFDSNRDVQLPTDVLYEFVVSNEELENHGTMVFYQVGLEDHTLKARLELFHQLVYSPYFHQLRQTEQLAYVLGLSIKLSYAGTIGLYALLQSAYSLDYIESRIDAFMNDKVESILRNLTTEQFERAKNAVILRLAEQPKRILWMGNRYWSEITSGQYRFSRNQELIEHVKAIGSSDVILQFYKDHFRSGGANCRRLVIAIKSSKCKELPPKEEPKEEAEKSAPKTENQGQASPTQSPVSPVPTSPENASPVESSPQPAEKSHQPSSGPAQAMAPSETQPSSDKANTTTSNLPSDQSKPDPAPAATPPPSPPPPRRVTISNVRKFKCQNQHWPIPSIIIDNF